MPKLMLVTGTAGPAADYTLPKVAAVADVVVVPLTPLTAGTPIPTGVTVIDPPVQVRGLELVDELVRLAREHAVDGLLTFSEWSVITVARAAQQLGLPGAGDNVLLARDKLAMRQRWAQAGVPVPRFRDVRGPEDIAAAVAEFGEPVLLKARFGCGSLAQMIVGDPVEAETAWASAQQAMAVAEADRDVDASKDLELTSMMVETLIPGTTESWYEIPGYGDYLSVEGILVAGRWHPVCITSRLPTIAPFTELSNQAPCVLPAGLQQRIEDAARRAVEALDLDTCGTHTEIKLLADQQVCLLETAARLGGAAITREVEAVHGVDLVTQLARALLGQPVELPDQMVMTGTGAAASVALLATDSTGRPWQSHLRFFPDRLDWSQLLSAGSRIELVAGSTAPSGSPMPCYDDGSGTRNFAGLAFLQASDARTLLRDTYAILDGLHDALASVQPDSTGPYAGPSAGAAQDLHRDVRLLTEVPTATEAADLFAEAQLHGPLDDPPRLQRMLEAAQQVITARSSDGLLVGLIRVLTDFSFNAFIADLAVRPGWQHQGLGSRLVRAAIDDHPGVKFVVQPGHDSGAFWQRVGFESAPTCVVRGRRA
jgi:biotin carboxylase/GNAT superfamily N-acetyltransferase